MLKIFPIDNRILIAFAGNMDYAVKCIMAFQREIQTYKTLTEELFFEKLRYACGLYGAQLQGEDNFQLIIGAKVEKGFILFSYNEEGAKQFKKHDKFVCLGTGNKAAVLRESIIFAYEFINQVEGRHTKKIVFLNALLQTLVFHAMLVMDTVGGFITTLAISDSEILWPPDTSFILYEHQHPIQSISHMINIGARENVIGVSSPFRERIFFTTSTSYHLDSRDSLRLWWKRNKANFNKIFEELKIAYWVFISKKHRLITILSREKLEKCCKYKKADSGKLDVQIRGDLLNKLLQEPPSNMPGVPIRLELDW